MKIGDYYNFKCQDMGYSDELQECIKEACKYCIDNLRSNSKKGEHPLMMLGKI